MRAWLSQTGVEVEARDFFADRFSETELRALIGGRSASELFSWASPPFRKLGLDRHSLDDDRLIALMLSEPRMIRRPLIVVDGELVGPTSGVDRIVAAVQNAIQARTT